MNKCIVSESQQSLTFSSVGDSETKVFVVLLRQRRSRRNSKRRFLFVLTRFQSRFLEAKDSFRLFHCLSVVSVVWRYILGKKENPTIPTGTLISLTNNVIFNGIAY